MCWKSQNPFLDTSVSLLLLHLFSLPLIHLVSLLLLHLGVYVTLKMILHCCNFIASPSQVLDEDIEEIHSVPAIQKMKDLSVKEDTVSEHDCAVDPPTDQHDDHLVSMLRYALCVHPISSCKPSEQSCSAITAVGTRLGSVSEDHIKVHLIEEIREELMAPDCQYELENLGEQQQGRGRDNYLEKPKILSSDNQSNSVTEQDSRDEKRCQLEVESMEEEKNYSYRINSSLSNLTAEYTEVKTVQVKNETTSSVAEISVRTGSPVPSKRADATKDHLQLSVASPRKKCLKQIVDMQPASVGIISSTNSDFFEDAICDSLYRKFQKMRMEKVVGLKAGPVNKAPKPNRDDIFIRLYNQSRQLTKECVDEELIKKPNNTNASAVHLRLYEDSIQRQNERLLRNEASKNNGRSSDKAKSALSSSNKVYSRLYDMSIKRQNEGKKKRLRARDKDSQQVKKKVVATAPSPAQLRLYNSAKKAQAEEKLNISLESEKEKRAVKKKMANPTQLRLYEQSKKFRIEGKELRTRLENRNNNNDDTAVAVSSALSSSNKVYSRLYDMSIKRQNEGKKKRLRARDKDSQQVKKKVVATAPSPAQLRLYNSAKKAQAEEKLNISLESEKEKRAVKKKMANPTQLRLYEQSKKFRIEGKELRTRLENRNNNNDDTAVAVSSIIEPNPAQIRLFDLSRKRHDEAKTRRKRELESKTEALFTKAAVSIKPNKTQIRLYEISKGLQIEGKQRRKEMSL